MHDLYRLSMYLPSGHIYYTYLDNFRRKKFLVRPSGHNLEKFGAGVTIANTMFSGISKLMLGAFLMVLCAIGPVFAQTAVIDNLPAPAQELSDEDNVPVIIKHLPEWEKFKDKARVISTTEEFSKSVKGHAIAAEIPFVGGTEAVVADYEAGKLAIVEFTTPQMATDMDARIQAKLAEIGQLGQGLPHYRREGNYAVFVFDPTDEAAAAALSEQVEYQKVVQWLGSNPYIQQQTERMTVKTTSEVVLGAIQLTGYILLFALLVGGGAGYLIFRTRNRQQLAANSYTEVDGMTTLNLDDFGSSKSTDRLLDSK